MTKTFKVEGSKLVPVSGIPEGAQRIHSYNFYDMLRPRGGQAEKESLSGEIAERLIGIFDSWTDDKYGDSCNREKVAYQLMENLEEEVELARELFQKHVGN